VQSWTVVTDRSMVRSLPGPFRPMRANRDPRLLVEDVIKREEVFEGQRVGRGSYLPLFLVFVLFFIVTTRGFGLGGECPPHTTSPLPRRCSRLISFPSVPIVARCGYSWPPTLPHPQVR
jgi:hypothetical protein